jgi:uncharacterized membrane protein
MRNSVLGFMVIILLLIVTSVGYKVYLVSGIKKGGHLYEISIPGNRRQETSFYTEKYVEKEGCIIFKDEFGRSHRICGMYNITEY